MKNHWLKKSDEVADKQLFGSVEEHDGVWHHVCFICDASRLEYYLDGELVEIKSYNNRLSDKQIVDLYYELEIGA
jgi:hypothetical protein